MAGIEPATDGLRNRCSTTELHWLPRRVAQPNHLNAADKKISPPFPSSAAKACGNAHRAANVLPVNLEDHFCDILLKARAMSNVSTSAAAGAAGISEAELAALETSGKTDAKINFSKLAPLIGLNPQKLEAIANGWLPAQKDLSQWR